jgi:hypothetical protein
MDVSIDRPFSTAAQTQGTDCGFLVHRGWQTLRSVSEPNKRGREQHAVPSGERSGAVNPGVANTVGELGARARMCELFSCRAGTLRLLGAAFRCAAAAFPVRIAARVFIPHGTETIPYVRDEPDEIAAICSSDEYPTSAREATPLDDNPGCSWMVARAHLDNTECARAALQCGS